MSSELPPQPPPPQPSDYPPPSSGYAGSAGPPVPPSGYPPAGPGYQGGPPPRKRNLAPLIALLVVGVLLLLLLLGVAARAAFVLLSRHQRVVATTETPSRSTAPTWPTPTPTGSEVSPAVEPPLTPGPELAPQAKSRVLTRLSHCTDSPGGRGAELTRYVLSQIPFRATSTLDADIWILSAGDEVSGTLYVWDINIPNNSVTPSSDIAKQLEALCAGM